jgi:3-oxoacyl-[acyl-carrier protein] reductase
MALELGPFGITVNAISPGPIDTEQARRLLTKDEIELRTRLTALEKYGKPEDVAKAALFLASEDSRYITGGVLRVDGGLSWTKK